MAGRTWVIVLAGGEGSRLSSESVRRYGYARPKQFCDFDGAGTLLAKTIDRALAVAPEEQVVVITSRKWRDEAGETMAAYPRAVWVEQPTGRDTTPGILLPLLCVLRQDPTATVVVLPSDHHVADDDAFVAAVETGVAVAERLPSDLVLLGAVPERVEEGCGWIVRADDGAGSPIERFREKPPADEARALMDGGALLNTFVMVGAIGAWASLCGELATGWWRTLSRAVDDPAFAEAAYDALPPSNFSRDVLERAVGRLRCVSVDAGWTDVGTPDRLWRALGAPSERGAAHAV